MQKKGPEGTLTRKLPEGMVSVSSRDALANINGGPLGAGVFRSIVYAGFTPPHVAQLFLLRHLRRQGHYFSTEARVALSFGLLGVTSL